MGTKAPVGASKPRRSCRTRRRGQQFVRSATHSATAVQQCAHWSTAGGKMTPLSACIIPPACDRGAGGSVGGYGRGTKGQEGPKRLEQVLALSSRLQMFFYCLVLMPANKHIRKFSLRVAIRSLWTRKKVCHTFKQQNQGAPRAY